MQRFRYKTEALAGDVFMLRGSLSGAVLTQADCVSLRCWSRDSGEAQAVSGGLQTKLRQSTPNKTTTPALLRNCYLN